MNDTFKIGHYSDHKHVTGCTVIICPENNVASCYISGSAPGSREVSLLAPERKIMSISAILLTGGSAFGLGAAEGVMNFLEKKQLGYQTPYGNIPIVPAAVIYDLNIGNKSVRPTAENAGYACKNAASSFEDQGSIGAGTGATVGKWSGIENAMKGGLGIAESRTDSTWIRCVSIVNAVGDILNQNGEIVAGSYDRIKKKFNKNNTKPVSTNPGFGENTVLCVVLTNARLSKIQAYLLAQRAHHGLIRAVYPANTSYDGDILFTVSSNEVETEFETLAVKSADTVQKSIINGVKTAKSLGGFPCWHDLEPE